MNTNVQRPLNAAYNLARDGSSKRIVEAAPVPGQRRQTRGPLAAYHHGVALNDEPNVPFKSYEKPISLHPSVTDRQRAEVHPIANSASQILTDAANLGRPRKKPAPAEKA
jgi:hypothetical protein